MKGKRKTLNASDVLSAMEEMEFQRFVTPLKEALEGIHVLFCFLNHVKDVHPLFPDHLISILLPLGPIHWSRTGHDSTLLSWYHFEYVIWACLFLWCLTQFV